MDRYKFRGKRLDNGEWVEGHYVYQELANKHFIVVEISCINPYTPSYLNQIEVDPETVGQYTGLKDKNGKEIYEGDILFHSAESGSVVSVTYGLPNKIGKGELFIVAKLDCGIVLRHISAYGKDGFNIPNMIINGWRIIETYDLWNHQRGFEVIGNIHDNPELVEG